MLIVPLTYKKEVDVKRGENKIEAIIANCGGALSH